MVRLTVDLIARGTSGYTRKKRNESVPHYLRRLTHLYLEDRNIDEIGDDLGLCRNLIVLYLYDNKLSHLPNINHNGNITHLYLQNNNIYKMEGLNGLHKLTKLHIGGNCITVVEGLDKLNSLQELHMENQRLDKGEKLLFDPRSINSISCSLQVLNVSGNSLDSLAELQPLTGLAQLMANDNSLIDMMELAHLLSTWRHLWRLELMGNPLCHKAKYRDRMIVMGPALEVFDGKEVTETTKQFLKNWQANRDAIKRRRDNLSRQTSDVVEPMPSEKHYSSSGSAASRLGNDVPGYIMPALHKKQFQEVLARSTSLPNSAAPGDRGHAGRTRSEALAPKLPDIREIQFLSVDSAPQCTESAGVDVEG